jgi:hypothetical protein
VMVVLADGRRLPQPPSCHELLTRHDASRLVTSRVDSVTYRLAIAIAIWK